MQETAIKRRLQNLCAGNCKKKRFHGTETVCRKQQKRRGCKNCVQEIAKQKRGKEIIAEIRKREE